MQKAIKVLLIVLVLAGATYMAYYFHEEKMIATITTFEECGAKYPVMESYPAQCRTPDGRLFVEQIPPDKKMSQLTGQALLGPTCPVMRNPPDPQCDDKPYVGKLVLTSTDGTQVLQQFSTDLNGSFSLKVSPGSYKISSPEGVTLPRCQSASIEVGPGELVTAPVSCDTGIR